MKSQRLSLFAFLSRSVLGCVIIALCRAEAVPVISQIPNQRTFPNLPSRAIPFLIGDSQAAADSLTLSGSSSNPTLVPDTNITFSGSGSNRTVTVIPVGVKGTDNITITVQDALGGITNETFQISIADFTDIGASLVSLDDASVAWGDYDNDGYLDLLVTGSNTAKPIGGGSETSKIYRNNGNGTFTDTGAALMGVLGGGAAWGDYNNDGKLDVLLSGYSGVYLQSVQFGVYIYGANSSWLIYRNDGSNSFTVVAAPPTSSIGGMPTQRSLTRGWADYDNDGRLDALFADSYTGGLFHNNGNDTFVNSNVGVPGSIFGAVAWGDYNNDGNIDFVFTGGYYNNPFFTWVFENNGNGTFTTSTNVLPGTWQASLAWDDCNNDGKLDIAMVGNETNGIFVGDGAGNFTNAAPGLAGGGLASVAWGDFDNDGLADLVVTSYGGTRILRNNGDGTFSDIGVSLPGAGNGAVAVGDFDNDGCLDIAIAGGGVTKIFRNDGAMPNTPPDAPAGLSAAPTTTSVIFSWNAASDSNQTGGFSYNLRVGTTPGGIDIVGPMADPASGLRRVPGMGNAGLSLSRRIINFKPGTYYWSVQAIDHAFAGSSFASEQTFTLVPPFITSGPTNQTNVLGGTASFGVQAGGTAPFYYQWFFNGVPITDGTRISGSTTSNLTLSGLQQSDVGNYTVVVGNLCGSATSAVATVTILNPLVTTQPQSQFVLAGTNVTFSVVASGQQPLAYQWQFNGGNIDSATNSQLVLTNVLVSQSGAYSVVITNQYGMTNSSNATLTVVPLIFSTQPRSRITWPGNTAALNVKVSGQAPFTYQWRLNGASVTGATTNVLTLTNISPAQFGNYDVVAGNTYGSATSAVATLSFSQVAVWGGLYGESNLTAGLTNVIGISGGGSSIYDCQALLSNGTVVIWSNTYPSFYFSAATNLIAIAAANPGFGLRSNGVVVDFPSDGLTVLQRSNIVAISANGNNYLALRLDGTVTGNTAGPLPATLTNIVAVAAGGGHYLALNSGGNVIAWGNNSFGQATVPAGLSNVVAIAAGGSHSLAVRSDGTVAGWGWNGGGQTSIPAGLNDAVAIAAGYAYSMALRANGTVVAWGMNAQGQTNVPSGLTNVVAIAAGQYHGMALIGNGPPAVHAILANAAMVSNRFILSIPSTSGRIYALEYKNSLTDSSWSALPLAAGNGSILILTDPGATNSQRFYQLQRW